MQYKSTIAGIESFIGTERGTSSRCPRCGHKQKVRGRVWTCRECGFTGHRDIVGAVNMHPLAFDENVMFPDRITYLRPGLARDRGGMNTCRMAQTPRNVVVARTRATGSQMLSGVVLESPRANHLNSKATCRSEFRKGLANTRRILQEAHPL